MTDFRAMCVELLAWAERTSSHYYKQADVIVRARALLAESDGREPASVAMQPSDDAIAAPLSPAAQAVLDAYMANCGWLDGPLEKDYRCAAAVLRAAVDQVLAAEWKGRIQPDTTHMLGINWSRDALLAIAAELESASV